MRINARGSWLAGVLCMVAAAAFAGPSEGGRAQASAADAFLRQELISKQIPGMSVAVVQRDKVLLAKGYGLADIETSVSASEYTVYEVASLTKPFTAIAIMRLVEQGRLSLADRVSKFLPAAPRTWDQIRLGHLLSHTSGLGDYFAVAELRSDSGFAWTREYSREEVVPLLFKTAIVAAPGERWSYSNAGYYVLGLIIEQVTGQSYERFLQENILAPLEMTQTRRMSREDIIPARASGYAWADGKIRNAIPTSNTWAYAEGGLVSSVVDLAKATRGLFGDRILTQATVDAMWRPYRLNDGSAIPHGLAWSLEGQGRERDVLHSGNKPGFSSSIRHFPEESLTVVVLLNVDPEDPRNGDAGEISYKVAAAFL